MYRIYIKGFVNLVNLTEERHFWRTGECQFAVSKRRFSKRRYHPLRTGECQFAARFGKL